MRSLADLVTSHGALAAFLLLLVDAVLPVGGELPMLLAGAAAAGAVGHGTSLFGLHVTQGLPTFLVLGTAGTLGSLVGSYVGWLIGRRGGRDLVERHGRWVHLGPEHMARADRWFARHGDHAVLLGRLTPLVRSFISVAAGVLEAPLAMFLLLSGLASALWCFGLAGAGWALGANFDVVHHALRYADVAVVVLVVGLLAAFLVQRRRRRVAA